LNTIVISKSNGRTNSLTSGGPYNLTSDLRTSPTFHTNVVAL